jgi:hypothetical protein
MKVEFNTRRTEGEAKTSVLLLDCHELIITFEDESIGLDSIVSFSKEDAIKLKNALDCIIKSMKP